MRLRLNQTSVDWLLLLTVVGLSLFSVALVYSASAAVAAWKFGSSHHFLWRQALRAGLSIAVILVVLHVNYHFWLRWAGPMLWIGAGLLLLTLVVGEPIKGATRWLELGFFRFQPSEFVKYALPLAIAARLSSAEPPLDLAHPAVRRAILWLVLCWVLIAAQPNASAAGLVALLGFLALAAVGVRIRTLALLAGLGTAGFLIYVLAAPYRLQRLMAFLGSWQGQISYQTRQSLLAFGHGGLFGVGPGQSLQRELFLPEAYSDFIFAIIGEEYGLLGTTAIVGAFLLILWRGLRIALHCPDTFGRATALCITATLVVYALVHMGVTTGLLPVTGVPLPFLSYGGSSVFFSAAATGILLNIGRRNSLEAKVHPTFVVRPS
ncbi:MAG: putative lipid II flippase FtsW [Candidatus Kapabacteria bacterium]|nr:putative lipid II flippase FtsW [Candidatus Kapabacteria bacterium]MDW8011462.1 putative peptidoglycan glycosyltransferase FtsW [Bacteroidota bacterium]